MKTRNFIILVLVLFYSSCNLTNSQIVKEDRTVDAFSEIDLRIAAEVFIKQESPQKITVHAPENVIKDLKTIVNAGTLVIKFDTWKVKYKDIKIYISTPEINELEVSGSGSITAESAINSNNIEFEISGSGKINIGDLTTKTIEADISGSGKINLAGKNTVDKIDFDVSGSGDFLAIDLPVKIANIDISGSGTGEVNVIEKLDVDISGSGKVNYKGKPLVNADISGSGSVNDRN